MGTDFPELKSDFRNTDNRSRYLWKYRPGTHGTVRRKTSDGSSLGGIELIRDRDRTMTTCKTTAGTTEIETTGHEDMATIDRAIDLIHRAPQTGLEVACQARREAVDGNNPIAEARALIVQSQCRTILAEYREALEHLAEARDLIEMHGTTGQLSVVLNDMGLIHKAQGNLSLAMKRFEQSLAAAGSAKYEQGAAITGSNIALLLIQLGETTPALERFEECLEVFRRQEHKSGEASCLIGIADVYMNLGRYTTALDYYLKSLRILEEIDETDGIAEAVAACGWALLKLGENEEALERFQESLAISARMGDRRSISVTLINIGMAHHALGKERQALLYLRDGITLCREIGRRTTLAEGLREIAPLYLEAGHIDEARRSVIEALELTRLTGRLEELPRTLLMLGTIHLRCGELDDALDCATSALDHATRAEAHPVVGEAHRMISDVLARQGRFEQALDHYRRYHDAEALVHREQNARRLKNLTMLHEYEQAQQEAAMYRMRSEQMQQENERQRGHVMAMAVELMGRNRFLASIRDELLTVARDSAPETRRGIRGVASRIAQETRDENHWSSFDTQFGKLHGAFTRNLSERWPDLSPTELRVCALIKLGMATKDIAAMLNVTTRCIETHRYSIRKKILLETGENLTTLLMNYS